MSGLGIVLGRVVNLQKENHQLLIEFHDALVKGAASQQAAGKILADAAARNRAAYQAGFQRLLDVMTTQHEALQQGAPSPSSSPSPIPSPRHGVPPPKPKPSPSPDPSPNPSPVPSLCLMAICLSITPAAHHV
jgi:hypothetical protein